MYTYVQTPPPAPGGVDEGAAKDRQPPGSHLGVLNFLLLKKGAGAWQPWLPHMCSKDQHFPRLLRGQSSRTLPRQLDGSGGQAPICVCGPTVCEHLAGRVGRGRNAARLFLSSMPQPQRV